MKKSLTPPIDSSPAEKKPDTGKTLRLRRRSVAVLTDGQMDGAAGGHPNHTCEPTCPPTCGAACPRPTAYNQDTCSPRETCDDTCGPDTCDGSCLDSCDGGC